MTGWIPSRLDRASSSTAFPNVEQALAELGSAHDPGDVAADDMRKTDPVDTPALPESEIVEGTGPHLDQSLSWHGRGIWNVLQLQDINAAVLVKANGLHA
tara:strand:- start:81 stop:380 length:300 start_codon:yes stop_codon:yes gene_type:complete